MCINLNAMYYENEMKCIPFPFHPKDKAIIAMVVGEEEEEEGRKQHDDYNEEGKRIDEMKVGREIRRRLWNHQLWLK